MAAPNNQPSATKKGKRNTLGSGVLPRMGHECKVSVRSELGSNDTLRAETDARTMTPVNDA